MSSARALRGFNMDTINVCTPSTISLKEALQVVKETAGSQAHVVRRALEVWRAAVGQLPQHPVNPYTPTAIEAVRTAHQQSFAEMGDECGLAWLKQYIPGVDAAIAAQLDKQLDIALKRISIFQNMRASIEQHPEGEQQSENSQLAARVTAEEQACALLRAAFQVYRVIGPIAVMLGTLNELEHIAASPHGHLTRRERLSQELQMTTMALRAMSEKVASKSRRVHGAKRQLASTPDKLLSDYPAQSVQGRAFFIETMAAGVWLPAALRFPDSQAYHSASMCMLLLVNWESLSIGAKANPKWKDYMSMAFSGVVSRQDLRSRLLNAMGCDALGSLLDALGITAGHLQEFKVPRDVQKDLLSWKEQAAAEDAAARLEYAQYEAGLNDGGVSSPAAGGMDDALNDMQALLQMMYGMDLHGLTTSSA